MNRDDIFRMGREAGFAEWENTDNVYFLEVIVRFAVLVAAAEREAIIDIVAMHGGSVEIEAAIRARGEKE